MRRKLREYHYVWLECHPKRDEEWLRGKMMDDFEIHHIDRDSSNNDPANLILLDHCDHFMLHSGARPISGERRHRSGPHLNTLKLGKRAYKLRGDGLFWRHVAEDLDCSMTKVIGSAQVWAKHNKLPWHASNISRPGLVDPQTERRARVAKLIAGYERQGTSA